jgi:hemoglobin
MRKIRLVTAALCLSAFMLSAASAQAQSLYDRLGGKDAIKAVVDEFVGIAAADTRINKKFGKTNIDRLKFELVEQICAATGGPCKYTGLDMTWSRPWISSTLRIRRRMSCSALSAR